MAFAKSSKILMINIKACSAYPNNFIVDHTICNLMMKKYFLVTVPKIRGTICN